MKFNNVVTPSFGMFLTFQISAVIVIIVSSTFCVDGRRARLPKPPLIEDVSRFKESPRATHCHFGNSSFELEDKWKPNLGPPFNVLVCIICECTPGLNKKSNKAVARVKCRNIKDDCPKPSCDEPVLLPGRCCKTCPGDEDDIEDELRGRKIKRKGEEGKQIYSLVQKSKVTAVELRPTPPKISEGSRHNVVSNVNVMDDQEDNTVTSTHKCYYEGEIFEDGSQWKAQHQDCQMCSCQRGRIRCHDMVCPALSCLDPITVPGQCCPSCVGDVPAFSSSLNDSVSKNECYFDGDKKKHLAGTKWHPYLPPFGFDLCSLCTCIPDSLEIECKRSVTCPPLTCAEEEAYRENAGDCCKRCPNSVVRALESSDQQGDQRTSTSNQKGPNELLASGGCKFKSRVYANGDEWHPTITSYGKINCVNAHCKDGKLKFKRTKCHKLSCSKTIVKEDECCPSCAD